MRGTIDTRRSHTILPQSMCNKMFLRVPQSKLLGLVSSRTISLTIRPMYVQLRRGAKFHPSKDKFMKKD
nr:hypothetical protein [uncultured Campylobacter sp.]